MTLPRREAELAGLRAVVTGASSGIGRAIAIELAGGGADVLVHARGSRDAALDTARRCAMARGTGAEDAAAIAPQRVCLADLADPCRRDRLLGDAIERLGGIDIWVSNAGADILTGEGARLDYAEKLERLWRVDVLGTVLLSRAAGEHMRARGSGAIVTIGWDQAASGMEGDSGEIFAAAKGAVMAFTRSLARTLAPSVRVNCIAPGWIRTAWGESAPAHWQERVVRETPLGRWGTPADVAAAARFLVSPAAAFVTGQVVAVNGGAVRLP